MKSKLEPWEVVVESSIVKWSHVEPIIEPCSRVK